MRNVLLLFLAGCSSSYSTKVIPHFSDHALEVAQRASPGTAWEVEVHSSPKAGTAYLLPHTELVSLRGRVEDIPALYENLELEVMRVLFRTEMQLVSFRRRDEHTYRWVYAWCSGTGQLTIWGRAQEGGEFVLAITIHESRRDR